jgi:hypothetical protein
LDEDDEGGEPAVAPVVVPEPPEPLAVPVTPVLWLCKWVRLEVLWLLLGTRPETSEVPLEKKLVLAGALALAALLLVTVAVVRWAELIRTGCTDTLRRRTYAWRCIDVTVAPSHATIRRIGDDLAIASDGDGAGDVNRHMPRPTQTGR